MAARTFEDLRHWAQSDDLDTDDFAVALKESRRAGTINESQEKVLLRIAEM